MDIYEAKRFLTLAILDIMHVQGAVSYRIVQGKGFEISVYLVREEDRAQVQELIMQYIPADIPLTLTVGPPKDPHASTIES